MRKIRLNNRTIGDGEPVYIIAEMSANHAGSLERAKELIHAAKEAGADCVKIQTYTPDTMTIDCDNSYFHIEKGTWEGENLYSLYQKAYTPWEWQVKLRDEAASVGIDFLSTPFDKTSVDFLEELGLSFYKIASFELVDIPLLEYIASKNKPIIMSTGMGTFAEIQEAVETIYKTGNYQLAMMKCSSAYPAKAKEMNLSTIRHMKQSFGIPVGLSDHSMGAFSAATAVALGANIIEKHFCISRKIPNPDSVFSMEPQEFREMVHQVREVEKALGTVSYGVSKQEESNANFRRSLFVVQDIKAGEMLTPENIRSIRPAYGLKPKYYKEVIGKKALHSLKRGTPLTFGDIAGDDIKEIDIAGNNQEMNMKEPLSELYLQEAGERDCGMLFVWANDPVVRCNAFQTAHIPFETHQEWFRKVLEDNTIWQYILYHRQIPVGQIRLNIEKGVGKIDYSIAPDMRGRGFGSNGLELIKEKAENEITGVTKLMGQVKHQNTASIKAFERCGYTRTENEDYITFTLDL